MTDRRPFLADTALREALHAYMAGTCDGLASPSLTIGGVEDHVHILCRLSRTHTVAETVKEIKRESSLWIKQQSPAMELFHWQDGYGAFSVSPSHTEPLRTYIHNQDQHHATETYQDEFRRLCGKYGIEYDERYVWD